jgi:predicted transposase YbfD/YdcC
MIRKKFENPLLIHLSIIEDPRTGENSRHDFLEILFMTVCAVVSGCENWSEIEDYAESKKDWFLQFLELKNGIPSHDTFRRIFCILKFEEFQVFFINWTNQIREKLNIKNDQICIDGKVLRRCFKSRASKALHMVSAWSSGTLLSLGQVATEEKSNEITAIPQLLKIIEIKGCLVSIDAMGCQRDIADKIIKKGADYLLAVKENQKNLFDAAVELFRRSSTSRKSEIKSDHYELSEKNKHGRDETRKCRVIYFEKEFGFFPHKDWTDVSTIVRIQSERIIRSTGEVSSEVRYYISSAKKPANEFNSCVRNHWGIENKLHWSLDVALHEDDSRIWAEESGKNFSLLRRMVLNLLKREPAKKGIRRKQKIAAINDQYLLKVLFTG